MSDVIANTKALAPDCSNRFKIKAYIRYGNDKRSILIGKIFGKQGVAFNDKNFYQDIRFYQTGDFYKNVWPLFQISIGNGLLTKGSLNGKGQVNFMHHYNKDSASSARLFYIDNSLWGKDYFRISSSEHGEYLKAYLNGLNEWSLTFETTIRDAREINFYSLGIEDSKL